MNWQNTKNALRKIFNLPTTGLSALRRAWEEEKKVWREIDNELNETDPDHRALKRQREIAVEMINGTSQNSVRVDLRRYWEAGKPETPEQIRLANRAKLIQQNAVRNISFDLDKD